MMAPTNHEISFFIHAVMRQIATPYTELRVGDYILSFEWTRTRVIAPMTCNIEKLRRADLLRILESVSCLYLKTAKKGKKQ